LTANLISGAVNSLDSARDNRYSKAGSCTTASYAWRLSKQITAMPARFRHNEPQGFCLIAQGQIARRSAANCPAANRQNCTFLLFVIYLVSIPNHLYNPRHSVPPKGAARDRSRNAGRDAVDAEVPITNGTDAYGEVVWS
jgi:hypothetical protein